MKFAVVEQIAQQTGKPLRLLTEVDNPLDAVRYEYNHSYFCDAQGRLRALNVSEAEGLHTLQLGPECAQLQYLNLSDNANLRELHFEQALPELQYLDAGGCALETLTFPVGFEALEKLYADRNQLREIDFQGPCPELVLLDLSNNKLDILCFPAGYYKLAYLYLKDNALTELIFTEAMLALEILHLDNNRLRRLPAHLLGFSKLENLYLYGNKDLDVPVDFIKNGESENSWPSIKSYLLSEQKSRFVSLRQAKLILVGNPEMGKSSIRIKLLNPEAPLPLRHERTQGLDIEHWELKALPPEITGLQDAVDFDLKIWDFGGQGRYREVQQLFCSRKSLYLYVTAHDDDQDKEHYIGLNYWLSMVNAFSFDEKENRPSPVVFVVNKIDEAPGWVDEKNLKARFPNIEDFVKISCKELTHFDDLKTAIYRSLKNVSPDIFNYPITEFWSAVKTELESRRLENHISWDEYLDVCLKRQLSDDEARTWAEVLDRIGVLIYFGNNKALSNWVILNPMWVKDALYTLLESNLIDNGVLRPQLLSEIWKMYGPADKQRPYTEEERSKLLELMLAYKLCYPQLNNYGKTEYIIPAMLSPNPPVLPDFLKNPDYQLKIEWTPYIPAGMINKLIVSLQTGVSAGPTGLQDKTLQHCTARVYNNYMWQNHVVVHDHACNTYAHAFEDWERKTMYIDCFGEKPEALFLQLQQLLEALNLELKHTKYLNHLSMQAFGWRKNKWRALSELAEDEIRFFEEKSSNPMKNPIHNLIAQGRIGEALNLLAETAPGHLQADVIALQSRLSTLEKKERRGIVSSEDAGVERNQIIDGMLSIELPTHAATAPVHKNTSEKSPKTPASASIYFSYAWGDPDETDESREQMVDELYQTLEQEGRPVKRDKMNIEYGGLISAFMKEIGEGDLIVVFISEKYLRSPYCMFELYEIARNSKWDKALFAGRILPVAVERIRLDDPDVLDHYFEYWEKEVQKWENLIHRRLDNMKEGQLRRYNNAKAIKQNAGDLFDWLTDMNAKTTALLRAQDFAEVKHAIDRRLKILAES